MSYLYDIFLSYKSEDSFWVEQLYYDLEERGIKVWIDKEQIRPGDLFIKALEDGIRTSRSVGIVVTPQSMASEWVKQEYYRALDLAVRGKLQLIPILLIDAKLPDFLSGYQGVDFRNPEFYERSIDRLIWPGITGKRILLYGAESGHWEPWDKLRELLAPMGLHYLKFSGLGRIQEMVSSLDTDRNHPPLSEKTRIVAIADIFGYWPNFGKYCNEDELDPEQIKLSIKRLFEFRETTRGTPYEVVFILYQHSQTWKVIRPHLDPEIVYRLSHYHSIFGDMDPDVFALRFRDIWRRTQKNLLKAEIRDGG